MKLPIYILFVLLTFSVYTANAQITVDELEPITLENIADLTEVASFGGGAAEYVSLSPDGQFLAVGNRFGIFIHDLSNPAVPARVLAETFAPIINLRFTADWSKVVVSGTRRLAILDVATGEESVFLSNAEGIHWTANEIVFSPNGQWVAITRGMDLGDITVWDVATGEMALFEQQRYTVGSPVFSPDSQTLAYAYYEYCMSCQMQSTFWMMIDIANWQTDSFSARGGSFGGFIAEDYDYENPERGPFVSAQRYIRTNADSTVLAATSRDGVTMLWDVISGEMLMTLNDQERLMAFHGQQLLLWDIAEYGLWLYDPFRDERTFVAASSLLKSAVFSADGGRLVLAEYGAHLRVLALEAQTEYVLAEYTYGGYVSELATSSDGNILYVLEDRAVLKTLDLATGEFDLIARYANTGDFAISADESWAALGSITGEIALWDIAAKTQDNVLLGHQGEITDLAFSADGVLASAGSDGTIRLWDVDSGEFEILDSLLPYTVEHLAFSPDGALLLAVDANNDYQPTLYDMASRAKFASLEAAMYSVRAVAFHPNSAMVALVSGSRTYFWDIGQIHREEALAMIESPWRGFTYSMMFNPAGDLLFASQSDVYLGIENTLHAWNLDGSGYDFINQQLLAPTLAMAFTPDGKLLVTAGREGKIRLWGVEG